MGAEMVRSVRKDRSQTVFSRDLGYRSNVAYPWESGRREPSASEFFRAVHVFWGEPRVLWRSFPIEVDDIDLRTPVGVAALLLRLRGRASLLNLATSLGVSRYTIGRWFKGQTEPKLSAFLHLVEVLTLRCADFVFSLCEPGDVPALVEHWNAVQARRRITFEVPWSSAILRHLETQAYAALPSHTPGWLAEQLGIDASLEVHALECLENAGLVSLRKGKYESSPAAVDTSLASDVDRNQLRKHWLEVAQARIGVRTSDRYSWSVFAVSRADYEQIRERQIEYMQALRQTVDASQPSEVVALASVQLIELSAENSSSTPKIVD